MKITFLGSGSAFVLASENFQSNILIDTGDDTMLFDAGTSISNALDYSDYTVNSFDKIFVSHNHSDHIGGLEYIGFKRYFSSFPFGENIPEIISHHSVLTELWDNSLRGGMQSIQGETTSLDTFFHPTYLKDNDKFMLGDNVIASIIQTIHVVDDRRFMPSYGLMLKGSPSKTLGNTVLITGDTQFSLSLQGAYKSSDIIFQDCELADYPNSVHAQYNELKTLPEDIKAKMWLYHYTFNEDYPELPDAVADGFLGFVQRGETFEY